MDERPEGRRAGHETVVRLLFQEHGPQFVELADIPLDELPEQGLVPGIDLQIRQGGGDEGVGFNVLLHDHAFALWALMTSLIFSAWPLVSSAPASFTNFQPLYIIVFIPVFRPSCWQ